jgi:hypothetical protein
MVIVHMDGFDAYGPRPTVQSIWDENELDDQTCEIMVSGRIWRLASKPWAPPFSDGDAVRDSVLITANYQACEVDDRHWKVFGKFEGDKEWQPVGWLVR